ncbi:MAG TPA: MOSC domain-containing protein [Gaiellaceae bacterium]|nr:MOSC domain-containing protein [Gaiellaceae bacterium]
MSSFERELRDCLGEVLGEDVLPPELDSVRLYGQWLAERNLGLVPIADAATFAWPGHWLARVRVAGEDHAVVMYGSPSGALFDPAGALSRGGAVVEGWLLAPLDLRLPIERPYGSEARAGSVAGLLVTPRAEAPLVRIERAVALAGRGLEGDRYSTGGGTFSGPGRGYELTLVQAEALEEVGLSWEEARRNVVTRGVELNALVGRRFRVGAVECVGRRLAEPCAHLEKLTRPGLLRPLVHHAGLRADILVGGAIALGDEVAAPS